MGQTSSGNFEGILQSVLSGVVTVAAGELGRALFSSFVHPRGHQVVIGACHPSPPDPSDRHYDRHDDVNPGDLPAFVDLRHHLTRVEDQGTLGSCTANAIAGAYEYLEKRSTGKEGDVSRLFIYYLERKAEGNEEKDSGALLRNGMKVLQDYGVCRESTWPYEKSAFRDEPSAEAYREAEQHTIDDYHRVPIDLHAMKVCLAEGYPFVFGAKLYKSFEAEGHHGRISLPSAGEKSEGGHAMLACGYSDKDRLFVIRNSWGTDWGDQGYCYMPYDYLADPELTHDCWTLRSAHNLDFTQDTSPEPNPGGSFFTEAGTSYFDFERYRNSATDGDAQSYSSSAQSYDDEAVVQESEEEVVELDDTEDSQDSEESSDDDADSSDEVADQDAQDEDSDSAEDEGVDEQDSEDTDSDQDGSDDEDSDDEDAS